MPWVQCRIGVSASHTMWRALMVWMAANWISCGGTPHVPRYIGLECLYPVDAPLAVVPGEYTGDIGDSPVFADEVNRLPFCSIWLRGRVMKPHALVGGRTLIITGDSMMRQVFQAAVAELRGLARVYDYYYHLNALYVLDTRTGVDSLTIAIATYAETFRRVHMIASRSTAIVLVFLWDGALEYRQPLAPFAHADSECVLATGLHYHDSTLSEERLLPSLPPAFTLVWVLMACEPWPTALTDEEYRFRVERQRWLQKALVGRVPTIDPCERSLSIARTWDSTHFQCAFMPAVYSMEGLSRPERMKTPLRNGTCEDPFNRWVVRRLWTHFNQTAS
jgi:hypothetical protein